MKVTDSHEWVLKEGETATVGITQKAGAELGNIVYVQLPKIGAVMKQGQEAAILESTKAAADTYAPVSGKVIAVNEKLLESPDLVNKDPQGEGWLYQLEMIHPIEYEKLESYNEINGT